MANTFAPQRPLFAQLAATAQPLLKAVKDILRGVELEDVINYKKEERKHLRKPILAFEGKVEKLRKSVAEKHIAISDVTPELREWVALDRATFYAQLVRLYQQNGLWDDVERVKSVFAKGVRHTSVVKDAKGNVVSSETITDSPSEPMGKSENVYEFQ